MTKYKEFDNINQIDQARNDLTSKLQLMFCYHDWRTINRDPGDTYFLHPSGKKVLWWAPRPYTSPSNGRLRFDNRFGYGMPGARDPMNAEAEINFPSDEPRNDLGGVFLRNLNTNSVVFAHRGIATRGKRIPIDQFIAEWQKNNGPTILSHDIINPLIVRPLLLIGDINSPLLEDKIVAFVISYCETKDHF
jgi:hypothetical protein